MENLHDLGVVPSLLMGLMFGIIAGCAGILVRSILLRRGIRPSTAFIMGMLTGILTGALIIFIKDQPGAVLIGSSCLMGGLVPWIAAANFLKDDTEETYPTEEE